MTELRHLTPMRQRPLQRIFTPTLLYVACGDSTTAFRFCDAPGVSAAKSGSKVESPSRHHLGNEQSSADSLDKNEPTPNWFSDRVTLPFQSPCAIFIAEILFEENKIDVSTSAKHIIDSFHPASVSSARPIVTCTGLLIYVPQKFLARDPFGQLFR